MSDTEKAGFLEESPGVKSSTRLFALILVLDTTALVGATCWYFVKGTAPSAEVIGAVAALTGALVLNGVVAIVKRGGGES